MEEDEMEEALSSGREEVMDEDIPDENASTSSPASRHNSSNPSPAPGDPKGNYVSSCEGDSDEPEFDGYDDVPADDEAIGEIHEEILGSFEDVIKRLNERIRVGVIAPWEWIGSFDENADSSS